MKLLKILMVPLSWVYGFVIVLRNFFYDVGVYRIRSVNVPVLSIGNLTTGGTGKTPIVEYVVKHFLEHGIRVAVVSRGYRRRTKGTVVVSDGKAIRSTPSESGDEPFQIARKFPSAIVVVDEVRFRGTSLAVHQLGANVIVLDDGFQHRSLNRDLDIVVVDVEHPPDATWLLPAGMRREPISSLKRAQAIVLSRWSEPEGPEVSERIQRLTQAVQFRAFFFPKALIRLSDGIRLSFDGLKGKVCLAFCGIAQPESFTALLNTMGLDVKAFHAFPDHYRYAEKDLMAIGRKAIQVQADCLVTTEKDAMRLLDDTEGGFHADFPLYYIELETQISDGDQFSKLLLSTILGN